MAENVDPSVLHFNSDIFLHEMKTFLLSLCYIHSSMLDLEIEEIYSLQWEGSGCNSGFGVKGPGLSLVASVSFGIDRHREVCLFAFLS